MYCPNCGTKNEEESLFCMECGTRLKEDSVPEQNLNETAVPIQPAGRTMPDSNMQMRQNNINQNQNVSNNRLENNPGRQRDYRGNYGNPGGPAYQGPPYLGNNGPQNLKKTGYPGMTMKKPVSRLAVIAGIEAVAAVALFVGAYKIMSNRFSPEKAAMDYWETKADREWSQAYDFCDFPNSDLLTKKMFVEANANNTEPLEYKSVNITDVKQLTGDAVSKLGDLASIFGAESDDYDDYMEDLEDELEDQDLKVYCVEYIEKGADSKSAEYITMTKTGKKKYLFWDEWKVADTESWVSDVTYTIPENAVLQLNGEKVDDSAATEQDGWKSITIPYMFTGDYQMQVTEEGMKPYCENTVITSYGSEEERIDLMPTDETLQVLGEQAGEDIKFLVESALQGKPFKEVQDVFFSGALEDDYIKNCYENLTNKIKGNGSGKITGLVISNINTALDASPTGTEIDLLGTAQRKETYINYWDEIEEEDNEIYFVASYCKEGNEWKLMNLPVDEYAF